MGERQGTREAIDRMVEHLVRADSKLAQHPERAVEIARGAALRAEGERCPVEAGQQRRGPRRG